MKKRKLLAIVLVLAMTVTAFTGCKKENQGEATQTGSETADAVTDTPGEAATQTPKEEPYTVNVMMFGDASTEACDEVSAAISKISLEKINVNVKITRVGFGSYSDQLNLALSSNETMDVFCTLGQNTTTLSDNGQIIAMNPYLDTVGIDIKNGISPENFKCLSVGDQIYGFPSAKETATSYGFIMLQSIVDELGIKPSGKYTLDQIHDICVQAKKLHPDMYPIGPDFTNMYMPTSMDNLDGGIAVLEDATADNSKVVSWYESDTYKNFVSTMYQWAQEGLILPDSGNNSESRLSLMQAGRVMGGFNGFNPGNVIGFENGLGQQVAEFEMMDPFSVTGHVSGIAWCIASNSKNPEKAMAFLNLAYTDKDVSNLLVNGIEGEHYVITDAAKGIIDYPEGVDGSTTTWMRLPWAWPNAAITYNWVGEPENQWQILSDYNANAHNSIAKGFKFDPTPVQNEITAINNILAQYDVALQTGSLDPAEALPRFADELKTAGVATVVAEKQKQLDAWLAQQ